VRKFAAQQVTAFDTSNQGGKVNEKQFGNQVVKVWRARQRYDRYVAQARKAGKVDANKLISLASALRVAALKLANV
jgi:hypothetical protein